MSTYTASFDNRYTPDPDREGVDDFERVAQEFDGDLKDPAAFWIVRVTNDQTGESRLIDTETWKVVGGS